MATIVGVMPPHFWVVPWVTQVNVWQAVKVTSSSDIRWLTPVARLKAGASAEQVQAEAGIAAAATAESDSKPGMKIGAKVDNLHEAMLGQTRTLLHFLLGTVSFVLLIACANVANLLQAGLIR